MRFLSRQMLVRCASCVGLAIVCAIVPSSRRVLAADEPQAAAAQADRDALAEAIAASDPAALRAAIGLVAAQENGGGELARSYSGDEMFRGKRIAKRESVRLASAAAQLAEYRRQRDQKADTAADHESLARWCTKNGHDDLANVHWLHVLRFAPSNVQALRHLNLRWKNGALMTEKEFERWEQRERELAEQSKDWKPKIERLHRDLARGGPEKQQAARDELKKINDVAAAPALLAVFGQGGKLKEQFESMQLELVAALNRIADPAVTGALAELAVTSPLDSVRYAATNALKERPVEDFIPMLLTEMHMPVQMTSNHREVRGRLVNNYLFHEERPGGSEYGTSYSSYRVIPGNKYRKATIYHRRKIRDAYTIPERTIPGRAGFDCNGHYVPARPDVVYAAQHVSAKYRYTRVGTKYLGLNPKFAARSAAAGRNLMAEEQAVRRQMSELNEFNQQRNERIAAVLVQVTGETLDAFPESWWNWWGEFLDNNPADSKNAVFRRLKLAVENREPKALARGTWVWTLRGRRAIEEIRVGDFVLSQNPESGDLAYQPVLALSMPREQKVLRIEVGDETLFVASGQLLWTAGTGWTKARRLKPGRRLHSLSNDATIRNAIDSFSIDCYDLVVDKSHTFFAGAEGLLVHDATPVPANHLALPGLSAAAVADAVELANNRNGAK